MYKFQEYAVTNFEMNLKYLSMVPDMSNTTFFTPIPIPNISKRP